MSHKFFKCYIKVDFLFIHISFGMLICRIETESQQMAAFENLDIVISLHDNVV